LICTDVVPTEIDPLRGAAAGFEATVYETIASPCPPRAPGTETQAGTAVMDHVQSLVVVTLTAPVPPDGPNEAGVLASASWHLVAVGAVIDVSTDVQAGAEIRSRLQKSSAQRIRWRTG